MKKQHVNARERDRIHALKRQRSQWARERVPEVGERSDSMPLPAITPGALETVASRAKQRNLCRFNIARCLAFKALTPEEQAIARGERVSIVTKYAPKK